MMSNMVLGLSSISSTKGVCECCVLGDHHKEMFNKGKAWHSKEPLKIIHSNMCSPLKKNSLSCAIYFLTLIDDYSLKYWVYFLKYKSETFGIFQKFKSMVENEPSKTIKTLRNFNWRN